MYAVRLVSLTVMGLALSACSSPASAVRTQSTRGVADEAAPAAVSSALPTCRAEQLGIAGVDAAFAARDDLKVLRHRWSGERLSARDKDALKKVFVLPCLPRVDLSDVSANAPNVRAVMDVLPESSWNELIAHRGAHESAGEVRWDTFSYEAFLQAVARMPYFCGEAGTFPTVKEACQREVAAFFAHATQETGAHDPSAERPEWQQPFAVMREASHLADVAAYDPGTEGSPEPCAAPFVCPPDAHYYGRGALQLSHFYNYALFCAAYFGDPQRLLRDPDEVARDGRLALAAGVWFYMTPQPPKPSMHDVMVGSYAPRAAHAGVGLDEGGRVKDRFAATVSILNGGFECSPKPGTPEAQRSMNRFTYFQSYLGFVGATLTPVERGYGRDTACEIERGNPWVATPALNFNPTFYLDTEDGSCAALDYATPTSLSVAVPGMYEMCTRMAAR